MIWIITAAYVYAVCRFFTGAFAVNRTARLLLLAVYALETKTLVNGQSARGHRSSDHLMIGRRRHRARNQALLIRGVRP